MNPLLLGILIVFIVLIILLGIRIYIYRKKSANNKQYQQYSKKDNINPMNNNEDKRHENFLKSINIAHEERNVIGTIYVNGKEVELSTEKKDNGYIYYLGDTIIGGYNPNIIGDNRIIFRENTLENQLSDQIKDQIVQVIEKSKKRKEQERETQVINERTRNRNIYEQEMGYQKSIGQEKAQKKITRIRTITEKKRASCKNTNQ